MVGFEKVELDNGVDQKERRTEDPPKGDVPRQRLGDGRPPKLDADQQLRDNNSDHHPALTAQFVAFWVVQKFKCFAQGNLMRMQNEKMPIIHKDEYLQHPRAG